MLVLPVPVQCRSEARQSEGAEEQLKSPVTNFLLGFGIEVEQMGSPLAVDYLCKMAMLSHHE